MSFESRRGPKKKQKKNIVTRKGVAERGFCDCASCVNARFADQGSRVNPVVTFIDEGDGFDHFWEGLILVVHGVHGKCSSLAMWDGRCRRKAAQMMK